jgi:single-strand DNA-binding protein
MIKTQIIGHLGNDCNVNNVNGKNVINFSVCHTEKFKDAQGVQREKSIWLSCAYWTDRTAIAPYLKKGTLVYVDGQPEIGMYTDKQNQKQAEFKLRVATVQLLGGGKDNSSSSGTQNNAAGYSQPQQQHHNANEITEPMDDVPF